MLYVVPTKEPLLYTRLNFLGLMISFWTTESSFCPTTDDSEEGGKEIERMIMHLVTKFLTAGVQRE